MDKEIAHEAPTLPEEVLAMDGYCEDRESASFRGAVSKRLESSLRLFYTQIQTGGFN